MRTTRIYALGVVLLAGCGARGDGPVVYPVSGKVVVDGKPAAKARVSFHALGGSSGTSPPPYAVAEADGSFRPSTVLSHDGAPAGEYAVTIIWPEIKVDHGEEIDGPDRLGGKYSNPSSSGLKATIKEGDNTLQPYELKAARKGYNRTPERRSR